jgi:hypothetical protein
MMAHGSGLEIVVKEQLAAWLDSAALHGNHGGVQRDIHHVTCGPSLDMARVAAKVAGEKYLCWCSPC